jgi:hypothetical protein
MVLINRNIVILVFAVSALVLGTGWFQMALGGTITPDTISVSLDPGECIDELKTVMMTAPSDKLDIVFALDTTESMSSCLDYLKSMVEDMIVTISGRYSDVAFGIVTFEDYPAYYDSNPICDYAADYGVSDSVPFRLTRISHGL